jgi:di/tricarboxylate transporter
MDFYTVGVIIGVVLCIIGVAQRDRRWSILDFIPGELICLVGIIILMICMGLRVGTSVPDNCIPVTVEEKS